MRQLKCPHCGRMQSKNSQKPWTEESLAQHIRDAHTHRREQRQSRDAEFDFSVTDAIAGPDTPDGAYWAIAAWLGEL